MAKRSVLIYHTLHLEILQRLFQGKWQMLMSHLFQRMYLHIIFQATTSASKIKFCQFILHACMQLLGGNQQEQQRKAEELERQREVEQQREVELQRELLYVDSLCSYFSILFHHLLHFMHQSMRTTGNH